MPRNLPRCSRSNAHCTNTYFFPLTNSYARPLQPSGGDLSLFGELHLGNFAPASPAMLSTMFGLGANRKVQLEVASAEISDCCCCTSALHPGGGWCNPPAVREASWCKGHLCITKVQQKSPLLGGCRCTPLDATWFQPALTQLVRLWRF